VIFHVEDIEAVVDRELYILQKKSITVLLFNLQWYQSRSTCSLHLEKDTSTLLCNLVRLSRGEMIGVKFNKDKDWVGGLIGLFEIKFD
jgi:hypothetical protein